MKYLEELEQKVLRLIQQKEELQMRYDGLSQQHKQLQEQYCQLEASLMKEVTTNKELTQEKATIITTIEELLSTIDSLESLE
ncbi:MAG: cell division protein ZapB [Epsilonproteobacteria bacterium]|nr:cell division protein ZapB [Campylobacterota bacterium]